MALADLDLAWTTPGAEFEGAFKADGMSFDKSRTDYIPTRVQLSGALRSRSGGVATDVMAVSATVTATGYAAYDSTQHSSASNHYTDQLAAVGDARLIVLRGIVLNQPRHRDCLAGTCARDDQRVGVLNGGDQLSDRTGDLFLVVSQLHKNLFTQVLQRVLFCRTFNSVASNSARRLDGETPE